MTFETTGGRDMRVATWNLERPSRGSWRKVPAQRDQMAAVDADIWVLSEGRESIPPTPGHVHAVHSPAHLLRRPDPDERWVSIWSRWPLRDAGVAPSERGAVAAVVETPLGDIALYGTVVPWHCERGDDGDSPNWAEHRRELERQASEWRDLAARFDAVCVAGDFNQSLVGRGYGTKALRAAHLAAYKSAGLACLTANEVVDDLPIIDHVLLSGGWADDHAARIGMTWGRRSAAGVRMSDHSGVAIDIGGGAMR